MIAHASDVLDVGSRASLSNGPDRFVGNDQILALPQDRHSAAWSYLVAEGLLLQPMLFVLKRLARADEHANPIRKCRVHFAVDRFVGLVEYLRRSACPNSTKSTPISFSMGEDFPV